MKKTGFFVGFILCLSGGIQAQQTTIPVGPAKIDSVNAVRKMFGKHRTGGWIWNAIGGAFALRIISVAASSSSSGGFTSTAGGTTVGVGIFGGVPLLIGVGKLTRFSQTKEEQIIGLYEKTNILPPYVKKRLKPKYFVR